MTNEEKIAKLRALVEDLSRALSYYSDRMGMGMGKTARYALERKDAVMKEIGEM